MNLNKEEFFLEATSRICGTLEIEKALWHFLTFFHRYSSAERAFLAYVIPEEQQGVAFTQADLEKGMRTDLRSIFPPFIRDRIEKDALPEHMLLNRADNHPLGRFLMKMAKVESKCSMIWLRLVADEHWIGVLIISARGWDRFDEKIVDLLKFLRVPFTIALSNSRRYSELLALKELLSNENKTLQDEIHKQKHQEIIGHDSGLGQVMHKVHQVAPLSSLVLLTGETGVGKEIIANAIHELSLFKDGPFIKVNCGAIPDTLMDSELFGHAKGAFTGALAYKRGLFERAHRGTIFLDEIGELPLNAQVRLLRILQEKEFEPVGGTKSIKVNIRIIAATHQDLENMVLQGRFRQDLYYRLKVFPIHIPPLRERKEDIPALVEHIIRKKSRPMGLAKYPALANEAIAHLKAHNWPGNVRELENTVERAMILSRGEYLQFSELTPAPLQQKDADLNISGNQAYKLDEVIANHIKKILIQVNGKVGGRGGAAELMGVHPATLRHKMKKLRIPFGRKKIS